MKTKVTLLGLMLFVAFTVGCKKEFLTPFDFRLSGKINGVDSVVDGHENHRGAAKEHLFQSRAVNNITNGDPCGPKSFQKETSSRFANYYFDSGNQLGTQRQSWTISFRACVTDSSDVKFQDIIHQGAFQVLGMDDKGTGVVIEHFDSAYSRPLFSTQLGPQTNSTFTVKNHDRVPGYETAFHYITEGTMNCTLYNVAGKEVTMEDVHFKIKTIKVLDPDTIP